MLVRGVYVRKGELFRREAIQKLDVLGFRKLRFSLRPKISKSNCEASPLTNTCLLQTCLSRPYSIHLAERNKQESTKIAPAYHLYT